VLVLRFFFFFFFFENEMMAKLLDEIDETTSAALIADSIKLLGESPITARFQAYVGEDTEASTSEGQLKLAVMQFLEKHFKIGDDLLAKLIISHGAKSKDLEEFEGLVQKISKQYDFTDSLTEELYQIVSSSKTQGFPLPSSFFLSSLAFLTPWHLQNLSTTR